MEEGTSTEMDQEFDRTSYDSRMYQEIRDLFPQWISTDHKKYYIITKTNFECTEYEIEIPFDQTILDKTLEIFTKYYPHDRDKYGFQSCCRDNKNFY